MRGARAARHRRGRQRAGGDGRVHRRPHRPLPSADDGADERRLRPAHLGGRHPAAALLGDGVRASQGARRRVPADRRPAEGLLGHADRRRRSRPTRPRRRPTTTTPSSARKSSSDRTARSPTSARTSRISSGSSACSAATSTTASSTRRDGRPLWATTSDARAGAGRAGVRPRVGRLQRHRLAAGVPAATAQAGARDDGLRGAGGRGRRTSRTRWSRSRTRRRARSATRTAESSGKPFVEVSGRKGLGVKADDLLDRLIETAGRRSRRRAIPSSPPTIGGGPPRPSRSRPCATSSSSSRAARSSRSTSTKR